MSAPKQAKPVDLDRVQRALAKIRRVLQTSNRVVRERTAEFLATDDDR